LSLVAAIKHQAKSKIWKRIEKSLWRAEGAPEGTNEPLGRVVLTQQELLPKIKNEGMAHDVMARLRRARVKTPTYSASKKLLVGSETKF